MKHAGIQKQPDTAQSNGATQQKCFICDHAIAVRWFCRIPRDGEFIVLCSPSCAQRYFDSLPQSDSHNGRKQERQTR